MKASTKKQIDAIYAEKAAAMITRLEAQVEALKTMPEGTEFLRGFRMIERRRARYVADGERCLAEARKMAVNELNTFVAFERDDLLFHDILMS